MSDDIKVLINGKEIPGWGEVDTDNTLKDLDRLSLRLNIMKLLRRDFPESNEESLKFKCDEMEKEIKDECVLHATWLVMNELIEGKYDDYQKDRIRS